MTTALDLLNKYQTSTTEEPENKESATTTGNDLLNRFTPIEEPAQTNAEIAATTPTPENELGESATLWDQIRYGWNDTRADWEYARDIHSIYTGHTWMEDAYGPKFKSMSPEERRAVINEKRQQYLKENFSDVIEAGKTSTGWTGLGSFLKAMFSPITVVGAPARIAAWGGASLARNLGISAGMGAVFGAEYNLLEQAAKEGVMNIDSQELALHTIGAAVASPVLFLGIRGATQGVKQLSNSYDLAKAAKKKKLLKADPHKFAEYYRGAAAQKVLEGVEFHKVHKAVVDEFGFTPQERVDMFKALKHDFPTVPSKKEAELLYTKRGALKAPGDSGFSEWARDAFVPLYDRIREMSPRIYGRLIKYEQETHAKIQFHERRVKDLADASKFFKGDDADKFWRKLFDEKWMDAAKMTRDIGPEDGRFLREKIFDVKKSLDEIRNEAIEAGVFKADDAIPNYFPRKIADVDGMMYVMAHSTNVLDRTAAARIEKYFDDPAQLARDRSAATNKAHAQGKAAPKMTSAEQAQWFNAFLRGYKKLEGIKPSYVRDRNFQRVPRRYEVDPKRNPDPEWFIKKYNVQKDDTTGKYYVDMAKSFYEDPRLALQMYVRQMSDEISVRHFFGRPYLRNAKGGYDKVDELSIEKTIGAFLSDEYDVKGFHQPGNVPKDYYRALQKLLQARFIDGRIPSSNSLKVTKELTMATLLGNPYAAITQTGDLGSAFYKAGVLANAQTVVRRALMYPSNLAYRAKQWGKGKDVEFLSLVDSEVHLNLRQVSYELDDPGKLSGLVNNMFKLGFRQMDKLGKNVAIEASLHKAGRQINRNRTEWLKQYAPIYGIDDANRMADNITEVLGALKNTPGGNRARTLAARDKINADTKLFLLGELADIQPVVSGLAAHKAMHGNNRYFYILGSFVIRQLGLVRRDMWVPLKNGVATRDAKLIGKAAGNAARWTVFAGMFNLGAYQIKHMLTHGELDPTVMESEEEFMRQVGLQAAKVIGMSTHDAESAMERDPMAAAMSMIAPAPFDVGAKAALNVGKAIFTDDPEIKWYQQINLIPGVGRGIMGTVGEWATEKTYRPDWLQKQYDLKERSYRRGLKERMDQLDPDVQMRLEEEQAQNRANAAFKREQDLMQLRLQTQ